jgi:hypothetical protein
MTNKQKIVSAIILLILIVAVVIGIKKMGKKTGTSDSQGQQASVIQKEDAPRGELVSEFPKNLVLDSKATIDSSFKIAYQEDTNQYTGAFISDKSVTDIYNSYLDYATKNNYNVVNKGLQGDFGNIYASKTDADLNVVVSKDTTTGKTKILITYLKK